MNKKLILIIGIFVLLIVGCAKGADTTPTYEQPAINGGCGVAEPDVSQNENFKVVYIPLRIEL